MEHLRPENFFIIDCKAQSRFECSNLISLQTVRSLGNEVIQQIVAGLGLVFINETEATGEVCFANEPGLRPEFRQSFTATDLLNYIYAILHSPSFNENYLEFSKTGIARIPYPTSAVAFWQLVESGSGLRLKS